MVRLAGVFSHFGPNKVMVLGDLMLDTYTIGKAKRISPEAPVAVVHVEHEDRLPGGAGNVALNIASLGSQVVLLGRIGSDPMGALLYDILEKEGVNIEGVVYEQGFPTPIKNRIMADNQQIVRVDFEKFVPMSQEIEEKVLASLPLLIEGVDAIAISDYGKGFLSQQILKTVITLAKERDIPIIVDPKGMDLSKYSGATMIKPNLSEAIAASGLPFDASLHEVARKIHAQVETQVVMITRSESGISLFYKDGSTSHFPVKVKEVKDVTGAGDTVLAMLASAIANGLDFNEATELSNIAAGIVIEHVGCARVTLPELARRLLEYNAANKVFGEEHLFALQQALHGRKSTLVALQQEVGFLPHVFTSLRRLASRKDRELIIYVLDPDPQEEFINVLASLQDVDFIILKSESMHRPSPLIQPQEIYLIDDKTCRKISNLTSLNNLHVPMMT